MGRRGYIFLYASLSAVWILNAFMQWWMPTWEALSSQTTMQTINMFTMPMLAFLSLGQLLQMFTSPKPERILDPHMTVQMGESLVVRVFRWLTLAVYAASGVWALLHGPSVFGGANLPIFAIVVLVIGVFGLVVLTFNPRTQMILTPESLTDSRLRPGTIAWEELADVQAKKILGSTVLTLVLRDTREYRSASLLARWQHVDRLKLNPINFGVDPDVLRRGIELRRNVFTF